MKGENVGEVEEKIYKIKYRKDKNILTIKKLLFSVFFEMQIFELKTVCIAN